MSADEALARGVVRELEARYSLTSPELGARLEGGYANDLFRVDAGGRSWVLRLLRPPVAEEGLAWEHALVRRLEARLDEVHAPLQARDGSTWFAAGDRVASLMPLVAGAPADPARPEHRALAAAALGRLHAGGEELDLAPRPGVDALSRMRWPPLAVPAPLSELAAEIAGARAWAMDRVRCIAAERRPRVGLVHAGFFPGNVMIDHDEVTGILDWDEAHRDWIAWDVANAVGTFCFVGDELDRDAARRFLVVYREAGGILPRHEDDLLVPLMRVKRTLEVLRAPTDRVPRWEHQRHNLRALQALAVGASQESG